MSNPNDVMPAAVLSLRGMLTSTTAAAQLGAHPQTLRRIIRAGLLPAPAYRVGNHYRIRSADLVRFLEGRRA